jgi:hypothetical protein
VPRILKPREKELHEYLQSNSRNSKARMQLREK